MSDRASILITGASTGIGAATALHLSRKGFRVFAGVRRSTDGDRLREQDSAGLIEPIILDITQQEHIQKAAIHLSERCGERGLGGLVNNAGIFVPGIVEFSPLSDWRQQFEVNVFGQVAITQALIPLLRQAKGRIINVSSISGVTAFPFVAPYTASKFALEAFNDALRLELAPWGIRVVSVQPGAIQTPIWEKSLTLAFGILERMPDRARELYGQTPNRLLKRGELSGKAGISADVVAQVIEKILIARSPRAHYLIGRDAKALSWLERIPVSLRDWLIHRTVWD